VNRCKRGGLLHWMVCTGWPSGAYGHYQQVQKAMFPLVGDATTWSSERDERRQEIIKGPLPRRLIWKAVEHPSPQHGAAPIALDNNNARSLPLKNSANCSMTSPRSSLISSKVQSFILLPLMHASDDLSKFFFWILKAFISNTLYSTDASFLLLAYSQCDFRN
jgi:hypothetical protein